MGAMRPTDDGGLPRSACLAGAVIYPAWGLLCQYLVPGWPDDLPGRLVVAALLLTIALAITYKPAVAARADAWLAAGCVVLICHYHYLVVLSGTSALYVAGSFITMGGIDAVLQRPRPFLVFSVLAMLSAVPVALNAGSAEPLGIALLVGLVMQQGLFLLALRTRLALETRLARADEANRSLSASLDSTFDGVYLLAAADGRILYANLGAAVQSGQSRKALVGRVIGDVLPKLAGEGLAALGRDLAAGGVPVRLIETVCRDADGAENDVEVLLQRDAYGGAAEALTTDGRAAEGGGRVERSSTGPGGDPVGPDQQLIAVVRDATARKRLERELTAQNERLTELDRLKSELIGSVSHELRTPLHAIRAYTELLQEELTENLDDDQALYLKRIAESAVRLQAQIDDLLDVARLEGGALRMRFQPMDPREVVAAVLGTLTLQARGKAVALAVEVPGDLPVIVADEERVNQVALNLVGNALKFTPPGGTVRLVLSHADGWLRGEVRDSGPGVQPAEQALIFEKFYQSSGADTRHFGGAGLGLAIARGIVEAHEGQIGVESVPGQGATFWFVLPIAGPAAAGGK